MIKSFRSSRNAHLVSGFCKNIIDLFVNKTYNTFGIFVEDIMENEKLKPMLFTALKGYDGKQFAQDLVSGIIVAIIALPLSIALALASGVGPEEGLYTAIVAGFIISFLGGSRVQIAGPTAAFATIVAGIVATKGMEGLALATIFAGVLLVLMGIFKLGSLIKFIPYVI